jgi:hypothetical protein
MWIYWAAFAVVMAWVFGASVIWALDVFPTHAENIVAVISLGLVCIVQAIALSVAGRRIWEQKQQQQNAAQYASRPPNEPQTKIASADPATAQPSSSDEQHQAKEELFWDRQIDTAKGLNYITLGAASVALLDWFLSVAALSMRTKETLILTALGFRRSHQLFMNSPSIIGQLRCKSNMKMLDGSLQST